MRKWKNIFVMCAVAAIPATVGRAALVDFETAGDLTNNFRQSTGDANVAQTADAAGNDYVTVNNQQTANAGKSFLYDTTPADATSGTASTFSSTNPITVSYAFQAGTTGTSTNSFGVYIIDPTNETTNSLLALLNVDASATNERIRFFKDGNWSTSSAGTQVGSNNDSSSSIVAVGDPFKTLTLTYSVSGTTPTLTLAVGSFSATSAFSAGDAITNPEFALRIYDAQTSDGSSITQHTTTANFDNFQVVPEPASLGMLGAGLGLALMRRRRA